MAAPKIGLLKIEKLTERPKYAKVMVYGETGAGKTVFASTAPKPILWLEAEGGTNSISDTKDIDIARVTGLETYREALQFLYANPEAYKTVVLDSFTETQASVMKEIMRAAVAEDQSRDEFSPLFGEWGRLVGVMREIARGFRDLPMHVVITALTREDKDDMTGRLKVKPRLSPTLAEEVPTFLDAVGYMYTATVAKGEVESAGVTKPVEEGDEPAIIHNMLLKPTGKYTAKIRAPFGSSPPDFIRNPTFADLLRILDIETN